MPTLNLTHELERLIADIVRRMEEFGHIDPKRVMVCFSSTRSGGIQGTYAKIHPLRFENGSRTTVVRRRGGAVHYEMTPVSRRGVEILYVIFFLVPRFLDLPFRDKLITLFHELYHISPEFNGDIRRFPGRNYAHGCSRVKFNALMAGYVESYLERIEDPAGVGFLEGDMLTIRARHGALVGRKMAAPKLRVAEQ